MNDHLVVALCGAFVAIIALLFLASYLFDQVEKLRTALAAAEKERDTSRALLKSLGLRPRPPDGGKG